MSASASTLFPLAFAIVSQSPQRTATFCLVALATVSECTDIRDTMEIPDIAKTQVTMEVIKIELGTPSVLIQIEKDSRQ